VLSAHSSLGYREVYSKNRAVDPTLDELRTTFGAGLVLASNQLKNSKPLGMSVNELHQLEKISRHGSELD
jgi:hypothetical protein